MHSKLRGAAKKSTFCNGRAIKGGGGKGCAIKGKKVYLFSSTAIKLEGGGGLRP